MVLTHEVIQFLHKETVSHYKQMLKQEKFTGESLVLLKRYSVCVNSVILSVMETSAPLTTVYISFSVCVHV